MVKFYVDKSYFVIDYCCIMVEEIDLCECFDIVLVMEVVEYVVDVGVFLKCCVVMLKLNGFMVVLMLNCNWKSFVFVIVGVEYVLCWLLCGIYEWSKFVMLDELIKYLFDN